jgi:hypothetical protein
MSKNEICAAELGASYIGTAAVGYLSYLAFKKLNPLEDERPVIVRIASYTADILLIGGIVTCPAIATYLVGKHYNQNGDFGYACEGAVIGDLISFAILSYSALPGLEVSKTTQYILFSIMPLPPAIGSVIGYYYKSGNHSSDAINFRNNIRKYKYLIPCASVIASAISYNLLHTKNDRQNLCKKHFNPPSFSMYFDKTMLGRTYVCFDCKLLSVNF